MKTNTIISIAAVLAIICTGAGSFLAGWTKGRESAFEGAKTESDTLIVRDTLFIDSPVPVQETPAGFELVRIGTVSELLARLAALESDADAWAANPDTVFLTVPVPVTAKQYKGEDYEAQVSGYKAQLDYVKVFPKTVTITTTQTVVKTAPPKWSVSPFAGVDIGADTFAARAGVMYDRQLSGALRLYLGGGYEARNEINTFRAGFFATGGVSIHLHP